jgi:hypothetical protein
LFVVRIWATLARPPSIIKKADKNRDPDKDKHWTSQEQHIDGVASGRSDGSEDEDTEDDPAPPRE